MDNERHDPSGRSADADTASAESLGFALNFISGRGLLTARERRLGGIEVKLLELEIPNIAFPFDVTGGADRFKARRCLLRHLVLSLDGEAIGRVLTQATSTLVANGFTEVRGHLREGFVELAGRFRVGEAHADFTLRAAPILRSPEELGIAFYDPRVYGFLPLPAGLITVYLGRALALPYVDTTRAGMWVLRPAEQFLRTVLPQHGWKIPDTSRAQLITADVARGRVSIVAGPESDPTQRQMAEREPPAQAVLASEGVLALTNAERALARGDVHEAYQLFRDAAEEGRGGRWARERLLQIGAADPELAFDTRQLAEEALTEDPKDVPALLALAAMALRERSFGEAANRYGAVAEIAHANKDKTDIIAAELAAAAAARPVDPAGALAAYERAAARARDSIPAHRALFELRLVLGDWQGAVNAGERLLRLVTDPEAQAAVHRELGKAHRLHLRDFKQARAHFERALRLAPDDPDALEGLAETYAARGEPARAASYLARLAEQAESSGDKSRIIALNLRLGDIWERWLADPEAAAARYYRVLDADPKNRKARLRLARLAEVKGELVRARSLYEDVLANEDGASTDPEALADVVTAYTRLARVTFAATGPSAEAVASLERAHELDPHNRLARDELTRFLRLRREWGRLVQLCAETAASATSPDEARRARLEAAQVELFERQDAQAAEPFLHAVLDARPDDDEALDLLVPLLAGRRDDEELVRRLYAAAEATREPERRGEWLLRIAEVRIGTPAAYQYLLAALDANPYLEAAARAFVEHCREYGTAEQRTTALSRFAVAAPTAAARARALFEAATILQRELGRPRDAEAALADAAEQALDDVEIWLALADQREASGQVPGARTALERALASLPATHPARADVHLRLAELARRTTDIEGQAQHLLAALANGADSIELRPRVSKVLASLGHKDQLATLLETWAAATTADEADHLRMEAAALREGLGEPRRAIELWRAVLLDKRPLAIEAARSLERLALERGDNATVVQALGYQLEVAPTGELRTLLARMIRAQVAAHDDFGAEASCRHLLEIEPHSALAHRQLAEHYERTGAFGDALEHWLALVYEADRDPKDRAGRRQAFERAASLALEISPDRVSRLRETFDREFPEAPPSALGRSYGEVLAARQAWEALLALRRYQIETGGRTAKAEWRREAAEILHRRLGRSTEAVPFYQDAVAHYPEDVEARDTLIAILDSLGRQSELASLLFALSQLVGDGREAVVYGLKSAQVYAEKLADESSAVQVLRVTCARADIDPDFAPLHEALRRYRLYDDLSQLLERSIGAAPDPEDGRFAELVALLSGPLGDVSRAAAWCERVIEAFPASDVPRRLHVELLTNHPEVGDAQAALSVWADDRTGAARAVVLAELARRQLAAGDPGGLRLLEEAAEADPSNEPVLRQLVDRATADGDFRNAIYWLEKLALAIEPGPRQDELWRRIVQIATDYAEDTTAAIRALDSMTARTEAETRLLIELLVESKQLDGLVGLAGRAGGLPFDLLLRAGTALADGGRLEAARIFLEQAMVRGDRRAVWDAAERAWKAAGRLEELGRWRLQAARHAPGAEATALKLLAYADLAEAGKPAAETLSAVTFDALARELDLSRADAAWALFRSARALRRDAWVETAARTLSELLSEDDPRLLQLLHARLEGELAARRFGAAIKVAERLLVLDDPEADTFMELVLTQAGRRDDLLRYLLGRAESGGGNAAQLWLKIAGWYAGAKQWSKAGGALDRVPPDDRDGAWGEMMTRVGAALDDPRREAEGIEAGARAAVSGAERADFLRRAARLRWWRLGEEAQAKQLLEQAHALAPEDAAGLRAAVTTAVEGGKREQGQQLLAEALVTMQGPEAAWLWLLQAQLAAKGRDKRPAAEALDRALGLAADDVKLLAEIAQAAQQLALADTALAAYRRAAALDPAWDEPLLRTLEQTGGWDEAVQLLETRAAGAAGSEAARRLERAADLALKRLDDAPRSLALISRAVEVAPTPPTLAKAFMLAVKLAKPDVTARVGAPLLAALVKSAPERASVLRAYVDALDAIERPADSRTAREELLAQGLAEAPDKLILGRLYAASEPERAAPLVEQAALDETYASEPNLLVEAAGLWHRARQAARARTLLRGALERGVSGVETHALAAELLEGADRLRSLRILVDEGADTSWPAPRRGAVRAELAAALLAAGEAEQALGYLEQATTFGKGPAWAQTMERALAALHRDEELAALWLAEITSGVAPWSSAEQKTRLQRAAAVLGQAGRTAEEVRALDALLRLDPSSPDVAARLAELALELGDEERYIDTIRRRLEAAPEDDRAEVVAEAASVLADRFHDPARALALLEPELARRPRLALGVALERTYTLLGRPQEARKHLVEAARRTAPPERAALFQRAAELARSADDEAEAYRLFRFALADDASLATARDFCLTFAERSERWDEALSLLERSAGAVPPAQASFLLAKAAELVRAHAPDVDRELALVRAAVQADPERSDTAGRLAELLLARGDLDEAKRVLLTGRLTPEQERTLGPEIVQALEAAVRADDVEKVMDWFTDRHPDAPATRRYRLDLARRHGDDTTLLAELSQRLADGTLPERENGHLRIEGARVALRLGDEGAAVTYLRAAIRGAGDDVEQLFAAWEVIAEWGEEDLRQELATQAALAREEVFAQAAAAKGKIRVRWLELLGQAHEAAGDEAGALGAFSQALVTEPASPSRVAVAALERLYTGRNEWDRLAELYEQLGGTSASPQEKADAYVRAAAVWRDRQGDEQKAQACFTKALGYDRDHPAAQLALGLLLWSRQKYAEALPYLRAQIDPAVEPPVAHLVALFDCLRHGGETAPALEIVDRLIVREPLRVELHARRAELLETVGELAEAEAAWLRYIEVLGPAAGAGELEPAYRRLVRIAVVREDAPTALVYLEQARRLAPDALDLISATRAIYERTERWAEAAELRLREASLLRDPQTQAAHFRELAAIYRDRLEDPSMAAAMLEKAVELSPTEVRLAADLVALYESLGSWPQVIIAGERLLRLAPEMERSCSFLLRMSRAYEEAGDFLRAKQLTDQALGLEPANPEIKARQRALAQASGDYAGYAAAEEADLAGELPATEKIPRLVALAEVYLKHLGAPVRAAAAIARAQALDPTDPILTRRLADAYALDVATYGKAAEMYRALLAEAPLDVDLLRILARLSGQMGDTDRAYCYYAALLTLLSGDAEAQRFVAACRAARPVGPPRPITDSDRAQGLVHPGQASPLEEVFAPLARFAELTRPGDLGRRSVTDRDLLRSEDPRLGYLAKILEPLGLPQAAVYVWRAGAFACELELVTPPAVLLGSVLATDAPERQRAFLVARAAELYRSGHALCEKLSTTELGGLIAALCLAVVPQSMPPAAVRETERWAQIVGGPMTPEVRAVMGPRVHALLKRSPLPDIGEWRRGCLASAARTALLVSCDVEEAITAMLRLRGFDDIEDEQRAAMLREAPEELDLIRFGVSEHYFKLRQMLGLALRRSK